jgi:hypothetical protein
MRLSKEAIVEFKKIYYQEFGTVISDEKARELAENLLSLFEIIYRPLPGSDEAELMVKNNKNPEAT